MTVVLTDKYKDDEIECLRRLYNKEKGWAELYARSLRMIYALAEADPNDPEDDPVGSLNHIREIVRATLESRFDELKKLGITGVDRGQIVT